MTLAANLLILAAEISLSKMHKKNKCSQSVRLEALYLLIC